MSKTFAVTLACGAFYVVLGVVVLSDAKAFWPGVGMVIGGALVIGCVVGALEEQHRSK